MRGKELDLFRTGMTREQLLQQASAGGNYSDKLKLKSRPMVFDRRFAPFPLIMHCANSAVSPFLGGVRTAHSSKFSSAPKPLRSILTRKTEEASL